MLQIFYSPANLNVVGNKSNMPAAVAGVITLPAGTNWLITQDIDLLGDRIVCAGIVSLQGISGQIATLQSTGLSGSDALFTTTYSCIITNLAITSPSAPALAIDGGGTASLKIADVNIFDTPTIGEIRNIGVLLGQYLAITNSGQLTFGGTIAVSAAFNACQFINSAATSTIILAADLVVTSRVRFVYCTFISANAGGSSIEYVAGASVPTDQFILDACNFAGSATTQILGVTANNNVSDWGRNKGIKNSGNSGEFSMEANATATVIANTTNFVKAAGTTIAGDLQRFTHSNNRLTYTGAIQRTFSIDISVSLTATSNNICRAMVRHYNSSNVLIKIGFAPNITTNGSGRAENVAAFLTTNLSSGDYLEIWVRNTSSVSNITVTDMQMIASLA